RIMAFTFSHPYPFDPAYKKPVAYFCMEYGIHQPLKLYAGGLGFLAGSHLRSAYSLHQNLVAIGILWKFGYYDQIRKSDQAMDVLFQEKIYGFLVDTEIKFSISVSQHDVWVKAWYLPPEIFHTAPLFLLSTDLPENDYLAKTICHKLYDSNPETRIAASILLGLGGARLLELLNREPEIYHLNESHALPLVFYLYNKFKRLDEVKRRFRFTNHTPEVGGNPKTDMQLLDKMGFFCCVPLTEVKAITNQYDNELDQTLTALRLAGRSNAVSAMHLETLKKNWLPMGQIAPMIHITNAQNFEYWADPVLYEAMHAADDSAFIKRKQYWKDHLFEIVADQNGEILDRNIFTLVFAKRFTGYKRPDLLLLQRDRFEALMSNKERPVQIIWAGKPYPVDYTSIGTFDKLVNICKQHSNCSILVGYELSLSRMLKRGADAWLNIPRLTHEASGTSGMAAAMNGAINISIPDGWFPEFARDKINSFVVPASDPELADHLQDEEDAESLYDVLEKEVLPLYYDYPARWLQMMKSSMQDIIPYFDSNRLAGEYYQKLYAAIEPTEE
ncbi:MAG TPA: alpha-glucan family phosphorylase, partial [Chitinophagaceae bacterium]|nr:alpha-glucan family phosphorylase [Chitinophagaceae bacterium]